MDAHTLTVFAVGILVGIVIGKLTSISGGSNTVKLYGSTPPAIAVRRELSGEDEGLIKSLIASGRKIEAIKQYRQVTGCGLKEAKDVVDSWTL